MSDTEKDQLVDLLIFTLSWRKCFNLAWGVCVSEADGALSHQKESEWLQFINQIGHIRSLEALQVEHAEAIQRQKGIDLSQAKLLSEEQVREGCESFRRTAIRLGLAEDVASELVSDRLTRRRLEQIVEQHFDVAIQLIGAYFPKICHRWQTGKIL